MFENIENRALQRRVKNHVIGREHDFFAVVQPGFEKTAKKELSGFGLSVKNSLIEGGVEFSGRLDSCYRASLLSRTAGRIMMRIAEFRSANYFELERQIRSFPWELYISPKTEVNFRVSTEKSKIFHTGKLEEIFSIWINERLASCSLSDNEILYAQTVFLRNSHDLCTVSLDASGPFLYKRGSGKNISRAPLRETTAALILLESFFGSYQQILDPMCGSGTFSIEAASMLTKTPPASEREFPFMSWPAFKESAYRFIKNSVLKEIIPAGKLDQRIITSDIDPAAVGIAKSNIPEQFSNIISPEVSDFFSISEEMVKDKKTLVVLNPPYGKRIEEGGGKSIYREIGIKIRKDLSGCGYAIIIPGNEKEKELGLGCDRKIIFMNGGIRAAAIFKDAVRQYTT